MITARTQPAPGPVRFGGLSAEYFAAASRRRIGGLLLAILLLSLLFGFVFPLVGLDGPLFPVVLLAICVVPVLLWHLPRTALYVLFAGVCLFEIYPTPYPDGLTDWVPFFWNVNTIFQRFIGVGFEALPLSPMELLLATAGFCSLIRAVYEKNFRLRGGVLLVPILVYAWFVTFGWAHGLLTGGDFKLSLQEVRAQFYLVIAYLLAVHLAPERKQANVLLWIMAVCIGIKGVLYTFRRYVTLGNLPLPDQGVGSHEEAFLFNAFMVLLLCLALFSVRKRLQGFLLFMLPLVICGNLATNRRAGTAALMIAMPILFLAAYQAFPRRRSLIAGLAIGAAICWSIYYPLMKNHEGAIAQPARALRSHFEPDARDASSNAYRDAENANLMATMKQSPVTSVIGYGYGKRMIIAVPMVDISETYAWWDVLPHNQILWVWMRLGTLGFTAFWMMIAAIVVRACRIVREESIPAEDRSLAAFALVLLSMLLLFALYDLQLSNYRDMLFMGVWAGVLANLYERHLGAGKAEGLVEGVRT